jgi:hypothetical protein
MIMILNGAESCTLGKNLLDVALVSHSGGSLKTYEREHTLSLISGSWLRSYCDSRGTARDG